VLDGWWIEGCIEGITGWGICGDDQSDNRGSDSDALYTVLEMSVVPLYYNDRSRFIDIMRHAIALNGSFFNTQRMIQQYVLKAYFE
jgi:starch phosphorylase